MKTTIMSAVVLFMVYGYAVYIAIIYGPKDRGIIPPIPPPKKK